MSSLSSGPVLVTGGCGFIGSNLLRYLLRAHPGLEIHNADSLGYAADRSVLQEPEMRERVRFHHVDLADRPAVNRLIGECRPKGIFHLAAETHVDNSIRDAEPFIRSNVVGTFNLLEEARLLWDGDPIPRFLHVSTDEVFGSLGATGYFSEESRYDPSSPYSASKAAADHLVHAWHATYGMNAVISNAGNNYGPRQHREKLIPTIIARALAGEPIPIYGSGENVRDWMYVEDHCRALELLFERGRAGEAYLVAGGNEVRNIDLAAMICAILDDVAPDPKGNYRRLVTLVEDRPGHDLRYGLDISKIRTELGWSAQTALEKGLRNTVEWYVRRVGEFSSDGIRIQL